MKNTLILFFLFSSLLSFADHNRAGEITYKQISGYTFEITITTYTLIGATDRGELVVNFGDGSGLTNITRVYNTDLPDNYRKNIYKIVHTYPGPGSYNIVMSDPNRYWETQNIPNPQSKLFTLKTQLIIDAFTGFNNTPILYNPPTDKAAVGQKFIHNPAAFDIDGDSLAYKIAVCKGEGGKDIVGYTLPPASNTIYVDAITGDYVWDAPTKAGAYNLAMTIEEYRNGIKIGEILRDMEVDVLETNNHPPVLSKIKDTCILAGTKLEFDITANDIDNDEITLNASSGIFDITNNPAYFPEKKGIGNVTQHFSWQTNCLHIRKQPYKVVFKAKDNNPQVMLIDSKEMNITIVAPKVENLVATADINKIALSWDKSTCPNGTGYYIYRKINTFAYNPDICDLGIPANSGYIKIGEINSLNTNTFDDLTAEQGYEYCYRIVAYYSDGAVSPVSNEICAIIKISNLLITNVSVENTDKVNGSISVAWSKPKYLTGTTPPYQYKLYRSNDIKGTSFNPTPIKTANDINDTIFVDNLLNTQEQAYSYKLEFIGNGNIISTSNVASSVFLKITATNQKLILNYEKYTPWVNYSYEIYRKNDATGTYDFLATTDKLSYTDENLTNYQTYCYKIKSIGKYNIKGVVNPIINWSKIACSQPIDDVPPCPPILINVNSNCDKGVNEINWEVNDANCKADIKKYRIFYSKSLEGQKILLDSIISPEAPNKTSYLHLLKETTGACYFVANVDEHNNQSEFSNKMCVDICFDYEIPNVFTPNDDGENDILVPINKKNKALPEKIKLTIFNRWGMPVFKTNDSKINWDGKFNNKKVSDGVYYYIGEVFEKRITGVEERAITGVIHIYSNKK